MKELKSSLQPEGAVLFKYHGFYVFTTTYFPAELVKKTYNTFFKLMAVDDDMLQVVSRK